MLASGSSSRQSKALRRRPTAIHSLIAWLPPFRGKSCHLSGNLLSDGLWPKRSLSAKQHAIHHVKVASDCLMWNVRYAPKAGFSAGEVAFTAVLEAVLIGHEDWVHSVAWQPQAACEERPCLLSASMDRTMALWRPDAATGERSCSLYNMHLAEGALLPKRQFLGC